MRKISVLLADDHSIVREGVRGLLQNEPDIIVVGEAADGLQALRDVERLKPAVLVVDLMMPHLNGLEVIRNVSHQFPQTRIVVLTMYANEPYIWQALESGASAYVLKESGIEHLTKAIREAHAGHKYLGPPLSHLEVEKYALKAKNRPHDPYDSLTPREREVLQLTAEGNTSAEVAARLFISRRTVEAHRANLMHKLNLKKHSDLIRYAMEKQIVGNVSIPVKPKRKSV